MSSKYRSLELQNVRCFRKVQVPLHRRVTVLIGDNGSGKTTVAEALACLAYGEDEGLREFPLRHRTKNGRIALYGGGRRPAAVWSVGSRAERRRLPANRQLFAYGRYRRVHFPEELRPRIGELEILGPEWRGAWSAPRYHDLESAAVTGPRTTTLTRPDNHLLRDLGAFLVSLDERRSYDPRTDAAWRRLEASLAELGHGLEGVEVVTRRGKRVPMVVRRGVKLGLDELSDGYQAVLVIVFNLILRYVYLFPRLDDPMRGESLVVIDEIDLQLHPRWQRGVVAQLAHLFPETQFVLSTHAPPVVQGAIDEGYGVVVLEERGNEVIPSPLGRSTLRRLRGAEIGSLLLESRLFGVESRYSRRYEELEREAVQLRKKLNAGRASEQERQRLIKVFEELEKLLLADEKRRGRGIVLDEMARSQLGFLKELERMGGAQGR